MSEVMPKWYPMSPAQRSQGIQPLVSQQFTELLSKQSRVNEKFVQNFLGESWGTLCNVGCKPEAAVALDKPATMNKIATSNVATAVPTKVQPVVNFLELSTLTNDGLQGIISSIVQQFDGVLCHLCTSSSMAPNSHALPYAASAHGDVPTQFFVQQQHSKVRHDKRHHRRHASLHHSVDRLRSEPSQQQQQQQQPHEQQQQQQQQQQSIQQLIQQQVQSGADLKPTHEEDANSYDIQRPTKGKGMMSGFWERYQQVLKENGTQATNVMSGVAQTARYLASNPQAAIVDPSINEWLHDTTAEKGKAGMALEQIPNAATRSIPKGAGSSHRRHHHHRAENAAPAHHPLAHHRLIETDEEELNPPAIDVDRFEAIKLRKLNGLKATVSNDAVPEPQDNVLSNPAASSLTGADAMSVDQLKSKLAEKLRNIPQANDETEEIDLSRFNQIMQRHLSQVASRIEQMVSSAAASSTDPSLVSQMNAIAIQLRALDAAKLTTVQRKSVSGSNQFFNGDSQYNVHVYITSSTSSTH
jgi:hypothetical protein